MLNRYTFNQIAFLQNLKCLTRQPTIIVWAWKLRQEINLGETLKTETNTERRRPSSQSRARVELLSEYSVRSHDSSIKRQEIFVTHILTYPLVFRPPAESSRRLFPSVGPSPPWCLGACCWPRCYWRAEVQTVSVGEEGQSKIHTIPSTGRVKAGKHHKGEF